ncbi:MAG: hypothetical protein H0Z34_14195 [Brevibacillus sp.]|nr:hypothetical protein [Brevibacillus sp.]
MLADELPLQFIPRENPARDSQREQLLQMGLFCAADDRNDMAMGLLIDGPAELTDVTREAEHLAEHRPSADLPLLLLVCGHRLPFGYVDQLLGSVGFLPVEAVRLVVLASGERAVLGAKPGTVWLNRLRKRLADCGVLSLVCRPVEAEEVSRALMQLLELKQQFFYHLAEHCDRIGACFESVAQGIGMDSRVGQGWLLDAPSRSSQFLVRVDRWLTRQLQEVMKNTNIDQVAIWGNPSPYHRLTARLEGMKQVRISLPGRTGNPNISASGWRWLTDPLEALEQADLLVILEADAAVCELDLGELVRRMKQPIVLDTRACYPLSEAEAYQLMYRTFGQYTNVWNAFAYNRI